MKSQFKILALALVIQFGISRGSAAGTDLPISTPEAQGMSSRKLAEMSAHVRTQGHDIRSMIVLRNGRMVFEWNAGGVTRDHNHNVYSVTKSVVATLTGIALAQGSLTDTNANLSSLLPDAAAWSKAPRKAGITVADLLTMRSGFPSARANKPTGPSHELFQQIHDAPDRVRHILKLDLVDKPGQRFSEICPSILTFQVSKTVLAGPDVPVNDQCEMG